MKITTKLIAALAISASISSVSIAQTTLTYSHPGPARGTIKPTLDWYGKRISELSKGDLQLNVQWGGALFKATGAVEGVGDGIADMGTVIAAYYQKKMVAYALTDLPIGGSNVWVSMQAADHMMRTVPAITKDLAKKNLVYVGPYTASAVNIACRGGAIKSLTDIAGKKVRGIGVYGKVFGELGATRVNLSIYKAYQALDTGLIDCTQGYDYAITDFKWGEVIDSYTVLSWGQIGAYGMFMNKDVFDDLSKNQQVAVMTAGKELVNKFAETVIGVNEDSIKLITNNKTERKVNLYKLTDADREALNKVAEPFVEEWKSTANSVGFDADVLIKVFSEQIAKYSSEYEAKGYPWERESNQLQK